MYIKFTLFRVDVYHASEKQIDNEESQTYDVFGNHCIAHFKL